MFYMKVKSFIVCLMLSFSLTTYASSDKLVNATITYGIDDNPFNLTEDLKGVEQPFAFAEIRARTNYKKLFFFNARADKAFYEDDPRADEFNAYASIRLRSKFKLLKQKFRYQIGGNYRIKDKTYVSKNTGLVGTYRGASIADRYDWNQVTTNAELTYLPTKNLSLDFNFENRAKDYTELAEASDFSYLHQKYLIGLEYRSSDLGRFFINAALKQRDYNDKRGKDLLGDDVLGTDLIFDYNTLNLGYIYRPNKKVRWRYTYNYEERRDNTSGYYNATSGHLAITAKHQFGDYQYLTARIKYSKFSLINQIDIDEDQLEEQATDRKGLGMSLGYEWVFATLYDTNIALYTEIEYDNFESFDITYTYESRKISLGVRWSAF